MGIQISEVSEVKGKTRTTGEDTKKLVQTIDDCLTQLKKLKTYQGEVGRYRGMRRITGVDDPVEKARLQEKYGDDLDPLHGPEVDQDCRDLESVLYAITRINH